MCLVCHQDKWQVTPHLLYEDFVGEGGVCCYSLLPALPPDEDAALLRLARAV